MKTKTTATVVMARITTTAVAVRHDEDGDGGSSGDNDTAAAAIRNIICYHENDVMMLCSQEAKPNMAIRTFARQARSLEQAAGGPLNHR